MGRQIQTKYFMDRKKSYILENCDDGHKIFVGPDKSMLVKNPGQQYVCYQFLCCIKFVVITNATIAYQT